MLDFLADLGVPTIFAVTKIDKLRKLEVQPRLEALSKFLGLEIDQIVPFSATTGLGRDELASALIDLLALPDWKLPEPSDESPDDVPEEYSEPPTEPEAP